MGASGRIGEVLDEQLVLGQQTLHALRKTRGPDMALEHHTAKALKSADDFLSGLLYKGVCSVLAECSGGDTHCTG